MSNFFIQRFRVTTLLLLAVFVLGSCATTQKDETEGKAMMEKEMKPTSLTKAADLRVALNALLQEHVYLAAALTNAALNGNTEEFQAAATVLDGNSIDLARANGAAYGTEAEEAFLPLWRKHIGFFVEYTTGVATNDTAKQEKAVNDLVAYTQEFGAFLNSATPSLPAEAVAQLVKQHALSLKAVVDARAANNADDAYTGLREAAAHMQLIADAHSGALAQQFPYKFPGPGDSPAADLRTGANLLLCEHVFLAAEATNAALHGRNEDFEAAAFSLDTNSAEIAQINGLMYGPEAEAAFLPLWSKHIGFVVEYTTGLATNDKAKQEKAVNDLIAYTQEFGAFLNSATPSLPVDAVADLVKQHVLTLKNVIDAQAADDYATAYTVLREAAAHMQMIADVHIEAVVQQFPEKFAQQVSKLDK
ncbi:MAG TPA: hypothetical protein VHT73_15300 [Thermodesulfobacteriota bacterium]|nr:hypothetical protein [Thermodesulfobacteriota bacterium]